MKSPFRREALTVGRDLIFTRSYSSEPDLLDRELFCLPMSTDRFLPSASCGVSEPPTPHPETILFVEDETLVRMHMAEFLRECGYRVQEAATAKEAIEALQAKFVVDLVFTDINSPEGVNGLELAEWTLRHRRGVKVLVTTGDASKTTDIPQTVESLLAKPYTGRDLLGRVRQALRKRLDDGGEESQTG